MNVESYDLMKTIFEYYRSGLFNYFNNYEIFHIIYFNESLNTIQAGWLSSNQVVNDCIYIILNNYEFENFNEKIYTEKVNLLTKKLKEYYVKKRLQTIEGDFEE